MLIVNESTNNWKSNPMWDYLSGELLVGVRLLILISPTVSLNSSIDLGYICPIAVIKHIVEAGFADKRRYLVATLYADCWTCYDSVTLGPD
jgi:hypothetical protein